MVAAPSVPPETGAARGRPVPGSICCGGRLGDIGAGLRAGLGVRFEGRAGAAGAGAG